MCCSNMSPMLKVVRIGEAEYKGIKAIARERHQFLTFHINEAIREYLKKMKSAPQPDKEQVTS
jgi:hypothetical protein